MTFLARRSSMWLLLAAANLGHPLSDFAHEDAEVLQPLAALARDMGAGETHVLRFDLGAGQLLEALVEQRHLDVAVTVVAPDGTAAPRGRHAKRSDAVRARALDRTRLRHAFLPDPGAPRSAGWQLPHSARPAARRHAVRRQACLSAARCPTAQAGRSRSTGPASSSRASGGRATILPIPQMVGAAIGRSRHSARLGR
jgi:hypothetical protein